MEHETINFTLIIKLQNSEVAIMSIETLSLAHRRILLWVIEGRVINRLLPPSQETDECTLTLVLHCCVVLGVLINLSLFLPLSMSMYYK